MSRFIFIYLLLFTSFYLSFTQALTCDAKISESELDSKIKSIRWVAGPENKYIYALTSSNQVYKSEDDGKSWRNQIPYMQEGDTLVGGKKGVKEIVPSANEKVIYFLGYGGYFWVTKDDSKSVYVLGDNSHRWNALLPHPTEEGWLLADAPSSGCRGTGYCYTELYLSKDYGATWTLVNTYVYQYIWGGAGLYNIPKANVWMLEWTTKSGEQSYLDTDYLSVTHSTNFGFNGSLSYVNNATYMFYHHPYIYLAQARGTSLALLISDDDGVNFNEAKFPFDFLRSNTFSILDDSEGSIMIFIRHTSSYWGHVYSSDSIGDEYDVAMTYAWRNGGTAEFSPVRGLEGVYIGNQVQNVEKNPPRGTGIKTKVTFNKGSEWGFLPLPKDLSGNNITCDSVLLSCNLHLHVNDKAKVNDNTFYGPFYSMENAAGIVLATGNVGEYLDVSDLDNVNTFISRDGGFQFTQILSGSNLYEMVAHGSLLVFTTNEQITNTLQWTTTEGETMKSCQFTDNLGIEVTNIVADPTIGSPILLVYGIRDYGNGVKKGVIFQVDFNGVAPLCKFPDDYEFWNPRDLVDNVDNCILGETFTYTRKKASSNCINSFDFESKSKPFPCACTPEDYECDYCFERIGGVCSKSPDCEISSEPPIPCINTYNVTRGYRLVPGNKCDPSKGLNLNPQVFQCPGGNANTTQSAGSMSAGIIVLIVFIVILFVGIIVAVWAYVRKRDQGFSLPWRKPSDYQFSTALDEDLLESKDDEAQPLDDEAIEQSLNRNKNETTTDVSSTTQNLLD